MENITTILQDIENQFAQLYASDWVLNDEIEMNQLHQEPFFQAERQIFNQLKVLIETLRKDDKMAYPDEVASAIKIWAEHSGSWVELVIEQELLNPLINNHFISPSEIEIFNQYNCYRQG